MSGNGKKSVVELHNIHKEFTDPAGILHVLRGLSLFVQQEEIVLLMGPSGSGKTTTFQIAGCLMRATSGKLKIAGSDVSGLAEDQRLVVRRKHIGFVFQQFHLVGALSVYDNVALGLRFKRLPADRGKVMDLLEQLGIGQKAQKLPRYLSGGEKQRVAIARGLIGAPDILLADEPTSQLDSANALIVIELLRNAAQRTKTAVLVASHDLRLQSIANRILTIQDGVIRE